MALLGLLILWPVLLMVAVLVKVKMQGGPAFFVQKRVGKDGKLFNCHKFQAMRVQSHTESTEITEKAISNTNGTNHTNRPPIIPRRGREFLLGQASLLAERRVKSRE